MEPQFDNRKGLNLLVERCHITIEKASNLEPMGAFEGPLTTMNLQVR